MTPTDGSPVALRPLAESDLIQVSRWLAQPHVARWWQDPADLESVRAQYRPCLSGADPTEAAGHAADGLDPPADLNASPEYRRHLAQVLVRRALEEAASA